MRTLRIIAIVASLAASATGGAALRLAYAEPVKDTSVSTFDREMADSMSRMHAAMNLPPSGDPDRDFAAMMIPHHQGAIDMAKAELAHGRDPVLRRLAEGILVEQAQEIDVMRRALTTLPPPPASATHPMMPGAHSHGTHQPMKADRP